MWTCDKQFTTFTRFADQIHILTNHIPIKMRDDRRFVSRKRIEPEGTGCGEDIQMPQHPPLDIRQKGFATLTGL